MILTIIESPFAGEIDLNIRFARRALRDSLLRGEAPIASHLLYTQPEVLSDHYPEERQLGIACGLAWLKHADRHAFYTDRGWSNGMLSALYESSVSHLTEVFIRGLDFRPKPPPEPPLNNLKLVYQWRGRTSYELGEL